MHRRLVPGLLALSLLALAPATADGAVAAPRPEAGAPAATAARARAVEVRTLRPATLRRGPDARIDHLQDGVIRTADGRRVRVAIPHDDDMLALLGRSGDDWLVAWGTVSRQRGYQFGVSRVSAGAAPQPVPRQRAGSYGEDFHGWRLDKHGSVLASTVFDRGGATTLVRDVVTGTRLGLRSSGVFAAPDDVAGGHLALTSEDDSGRVRVIDWTPPDTDRVIARSASGVDLGRDLAFVRTQRRDYGPTSASAPGVPAWAAPFAPLDVSPDGTLVIGTRISRSGFDDRGVLEVRSMADGTLLDAVSLGDRITMDNWSITSSHEQTIRWESDTRYLVQLRAPGGAVLVRCRVAGRCERASDAGGGISTPYEYFMWPQR